MSFGAKILPLGDCIAVSAGYPFRGSIPEVPDGDVLAVQIKDLDPASGVDWPGVLRTTLPGRKQPDWLVAGDLLLVVRGVRFYAVCLDTPPPPRAVCSQHLFHLRVQRTMALPAFIAWQINQPPFQLQLQQGAEGSNQLSIRRPVLEALRLSLPPLADQRRIVALAALAQQERQTLTQLIRNREQQMGALAAGLFQAAP